MLTIVVRNRRLCCRFSVRNDMQMRRKCDAKAVGGNHQKYDLLLFSIRKTSPPLWAQSLLSYSWITPMLLIVYMYFWWRVWKDGKQSSVIASRRADVVNIRKYGWIQRVFLREDTRSRTYTGRRTATVRVSLNWSVVISSVYLRAFCFAPSVGWGRDLTLFFSLSERYGLLLQPTDK